MTPLPGPAMGLGHPPHPAYVYPQPHPYMLPVPPHPFLQVYHPGMPGMGPGVPVHYQVGGPQGHSRPVPPPSPQDPRTAVRRRRSGPD